MNMWERMKTLEGKYIDLANYYKRELATNSQIRGNSIDGIGGPDGMSSVNTSKSAVGGVIQRPPYSESQTSLAQQLGDGRPSRVPGDDLSEEGIISELRNEKLRFEQIVKSVISGKGNSTDPLSSGQFTNDELTRFNMELEGAFKDILDQVDQS